MSRILAISELAWPEGGGAELATYEILKILSKRHEVIQVTSTPSPQPIPGVRIITTPHLKPATRPIYLLRVAKMVKENWFQKLLKKVDTVYITGYALPVAREAKKYSKRVILHTHNYTIAKYSGVNYAYEKGANTLNDIKYAIHHELRHHHSTTRALGVLPLYPLFKFTTRLLDYVDTIICVSRKQAHIISQYLPNQRKKIAVIYNPIPEDLANMDADFVEKKNWAIYVGGKSYIKGWYIFLKIALETAKKKLPILYKVTNIKTRLPLGNVEFLGRLSHNDVLKLFQQSIALLFPSMWEEPLPYVIIEAGILRTIPIAFEVGGVKEILENTKAERFLVKQLDVNTMLTKIIEVINLDKNEFIDITTDIRDKLIKKFNSEKNIEAIYKVFL